MPRKARKNINSEFLHIMVQGLNKEYIFNEEKERMRYLNLLSNDIQDFNLKIVAYCIMSNHVHLLVFAENIAEVSKFMGKINTKYAMYYNKAHNRCGYVFRDRYKAEEIYTRSHLLCCINYIHNNPVKAKMCKNKGDYKYSSYNDYLYKKGFVNEELIQKCLLDYGIEYNDIFAKEFETLKFIECENDDKDIKEKIIQEFLKKEDLTVEELKNNPIILKNLIVKLNMEYNITQKEIAERLGINKIKVNRILRSEK